MSRIALVTGGSRGIGAAISTALQAADYTVAATYAGNDEKAAAFTAETGIKTYKWDVSDYDACAAGIAAVEADLGSIDILVNNAGITRDAPFHKMSRDQWNDVMRTNLDGVFNMTHPLWNGMRERKFGRISIFPRSTGKKASSHKQTIPPPKRATLGSPKLWPKRARGQALP